MQWNDFKPGSNLTVQEALNRASAIFKEAGLEYPRQEAQILFSRVLDWDRLKVVLEANTNLSQMQADRLKVAVKRRANGEPLAYIAGSKEFYSLEFTVNPAVLIPRPETELLIESALEWADRAGYSRGKGVLAVDLGTGSGNLAVTLAVLWPRAQFKAVDISAHALAVADENAYRHGVQDRISWYRGNYFSALSGIDPPPKFNLIVSNPPYIPQAELARLPLPVKGFEPLEALNGGADGLNGYRRLLSGLSRHLLSPGLVAVEIGAGQYQDVSGLFKSTGLFHRIEVRHDYQGRPRVVEGFAC
ncbi:MAG TPA: peptide chain release factor N(5)-glutamine methyltransferase [Firmicutes bacterium]|nr:peptide chain release factor N(5)-glutamine methyltransferase [Bacillota bacterium]